MSFCPTKDIHSVYLDNELPDVYKADYEKHLSECAKCRNELAELKAVRAVFQDDVASITPDEQFLDDSYERLMIKMSYEKNSKRTKKPLLFKIGSAVSAAAAVLVAIFIPIGLSSKKNTVNTEVPSVINRMLSMQQFGNNISFGSGNNGALSGNMEGVMLSPNNYVNYFNYGDYNGYNSSNYGVGDYNYADMNLFGHIEGINILQPKSLEDDVISIRVTVPRLDNAPFYLDNFKDGAVLSGNNLWNLLEN